MKILYVDPAGTPIWLDQLSGLLNAHKEPDTQVDVVHLQLSTPVKSPFLPKIPYFYNEIFKRIYEGEKAGYDAAIIGCASDPGLQPAANMVRIPVLGPMRAGLHMALLAGKRVGVICPCHGGKRSRPLSMHEDNVLAYGVRERVVSFRAAEVPTRDGEMAAYLEKGDITGLKAYMLAQFRYAITDDAMNQARRAITEDRADVLLFACTLWGGMLSPIAEELGVPVIDPVIGTLKAAEMVVKGIRATRR